MAYQRKTEDEFQIHGDYGHGAGFEEVTCETTRAEGLARLREYRENEPGVPFKLVTKRLPIDDGRCPHGMFYSGAGGCPACSS